MKQLIVPITIFVALIAFFAANGSEAAIINHKGIQLSDVQSVQRERPTTNRQSAISVSQTKLMTELKSVEEIISAKSETDETKKLELVLATEKEPMVEFMSAELNPIADINLFSPTAVPVITPEEAIKANEEALRFFQINKAIAETKDTIAVAETKTEDKPSPQTRFFFTHLDFTNFFISLLPLLLIIDAFLFKKKKKSCRKEHQHMIYKICCKVFIDLSLSRRMRILLSVSLLAFGVLVFVPWSVYFGNSQNFDFIFHDFVNKNLCALTISIVGISLILLLIPPIISDYLVAIIAGLGLCVYVQAMFMNQYLGRMDGTEPVWSDHYIFGIINLMIWIIIVLVPVVLRKVIPTLFSKVISTITGTILFLELLATVSMVFSASQDVWSRSITFSQDGINQFQLSKEKNVVVFIFDNLSIDFIKMCFEDSPETKSIVKDFVWFDDARSNYDATFPAVCHELTGSFMHVPAKDSYDLFEKSWQSPSAKSFYNQIKKAGYDARLYARMKEMTLGSQEIYHEYFSNIHEDKLSCIIDYRLLSLCLMNMSGFSSMPFLVKKYFFYSLEDSFGNIVQLQTVNSSLDRNKIPVSNDAFFHKMVSCGIETSAEKPVLSFHYTKGVHAPRYIDEKCNRLTDKIDNPVPATKSCFYILSKFITLLKENNIYDKTAIVVISDHGAHEDFPGRSNPSGRANPYDMCFMIKPFFENKSELSTSEAKVQSVDILPTLLHIICGDNADYKGFEGCTAFNVPVDRIVRKVYRGIHTGNLADHPVNSFTHFEEYLFVDAASFKYGTKSKAFVRRIPLVSSSLPQEETK